MKVPRVTVKTTSAAAGWVYKQAKRLGQSLTARTHMRKSRVIDGFVLQASRTGDQARVLILDTPALLAVPGRVLNGGGAAIEHCPLVVVEEGRDGMLRPVVGGPRTLAPSHPGTGGSGYLQLGELAPSLVHTLLAKSRPSMSPLPAFGVVYTWVVNRTLGLYAVNAYAFMGPTDRVVYQFQCYAPSLGQATYEANPAGGWNSTRVDPYPVPLSVVMSDSVLGSYLPFSKRLSPPAYNPADVSQTAYAAAQNVWARSLSAGFTVDRGVTSHNIVVVVHVVCDAIDDFDRFGAKGLWFAGLRVLTGEVPYPTATVVWSQAFDMRASGDPRSTPTVIPQGYTTNDIQPAMLCRLDSGMTLALAVSNCFQKGYAADPELYQVFATVTGYRVDPVRGLVTNQRVMGPTLSNLSLSLPMQPHDGAFPVGMGTDGVAAYAILFSTDSMRQSGGSYAAEPSIDVVRMDETTQSVVLRTTSTGRVCFFATATTECVRYIGNNKFLYVATSAISDDLPIAKGNLAVYVYDAEANTVSFRGEVDGTLRYAETRCVGQLDCPALELARGGVVSRMATVVLTTGSTAQLAGEPGGEDGTTYISYDSGATWSVLATYGSAAGVRYCGTILQSRFKEL